MNQRIEIFAIQHGTTVKQLSRSAFFVALSALLLWFAVTHYEDYEEVKLQIGQFEKIDKKLRADLAEVYQVLNGEKVIIERDSKNYLMITQVETHVVENYKDHLELLNKGENQ
jgi:hypothetical protein